MPPRRSARVAAVAERASSALAPLPLALALMIFALLPADARARCAAVCRGWRAVMSEVSLWTRLDLSVSSGVTRRVTDALLRAVTAKARGALQALDVTGCDNITEAALLPVVTANAGALHELRACCATNGRIACFTPSRLLALLRAAPQLRLLTADVECDDFDDAAVRQMLRNEGAFAPLRLRRFQAESTPATAPALDGISFAADLAAHESLEQLELCGFALDAAALDAVVGAALARRLYAVTFTTCTLSATCAPALARLLSGDELRFFSVFNMDDTYMMLAGAAGALLGDVLRANDKLMRLSLLNCGIWHDAAAGAALVGALTAHRSLQHVDLSCNSAGAHAAAAGAAFAALIAADAPALTTLRVKVSTLGDEGLGPVVDALAGNTHLRTLHIDNNDMTEAFARNRLLPAVRANTSLTRLSTDTDFPAALEAEALVAARAPR
jgi:hypothetical protein